MGGGVGMGNTCKPMAVSFQCMTKFTTNKKIKQNKIKKKRVSFGQNVYVISETVRGASPTGISGQG